jgi:Carbohydrate binding module (family 6)
MKVRVHGDADVAYRDVSPGNTGGAYRATDVDLEATTDNGGGYNVGWMAPGEWLVYSVSVPSAGSYRLDLRVAATGEGGRLHVEFDGVDKTGPLTIPNTGGWQQWATISAPVALSAGAQRMRVVVDAASAAGIVGNLNFVQVVSAEPAPQPTDIVLYANDIPIGALHGSWAKAEDPTSPDIVKLSTTNTGFAVTTAPLATPAHYVDVPFTPLANVPYTLWLRLKALNDEKSNDAVWVQFSGAYANGTPVFQVNSTSGLLVNLATDSTAASVRNWGWQNGAYWLSQPGTFTFPAGGTQTLRIQVREDGVQLDQVVLSPSKYLSSPPGGPTNDTTIVPKS